jgi:UDP-N-acetylglucosamine 4-epimerase
MKILVTGGAGFIGSNLVEVLLKEERITFVRVLDDLSTGFLQNIEEFFDNPKFEFLEGDIRNYSTCLKACKGMNLISHQAALGSVPRSIKDPITTNSVNVSGFLNIFTAAKDSGIKRIVFAASSSTYGDSKPLPKVEDVIGNPLSPYAVTKLVNELYADVFANLYGIEFIGLRYFNIFGPKQDPKGAYAAVIPILFDKALKNISPTINGDGSYSRDFTYVENAVDANLLSLFTTNKESVNQIYNIACGERTTLTQLWESIKKLTGNDVNAVYGLNRVGDIPHSLAEISKAKSLLGYKANVTVKSGMEKTFDWYKKSL